MSASSSLGYGDLVDVPAGSQSNDEVLRLRERVQSASDLFFTDRPSARAIALSALTENEERLEAEQRREARFLLWRATGDRAHLEDAKRLLDESLANVPEEYHEAMLTNLRLNREIMAAWDGESGAPEPPPAARDDPDDDEPRGTESVTRVG